MCLTRRGAFCVRACVVCLVCQGFGSGTPAPGYQWNAGVRGKPPFCCRINRGGGPWSVVFYWKSKNSGKPALEFFFSSGHFFFSQAAAFPPERHLKFFHSQSPLKPGPEQRWIDHEAAFALQISTKISCYYNTALDSAAPLHSSFINRGIASALRSSQPTRDRQNTANQEKEDEKKWWQRRRCCLEAWSWLRNKSFVESSSMFSSLTRLRLEQPTEWMSATATPDFWETQNADFIKKKNAKFMRPGVFAWMRDLGLKIWKCIFHCRAGKLKCSTHLSMLTWPLVVLPVHILNFNFDPSLWLFLKNKAHCGPNPAPVV